MSAGADGDAVGAGGMSLRLRLTAWIVSVTGISYIVLLAFVMLQHRNALGEFFNERVGSRVLSLADTLAKSPEPITDQTLERVGTRTPRLMLDTHTILAVYDGQGNVIASSQRPAPDAPSLHLDESRAMGGTRIARRALHGLHAEGDDMYRVAVRQVPLGGRPASLVFITTDEHYETLVASSARIIAITTALGVVVALGAAWLIAGQAVAPFGRLRRLAASLWPDHPDAPPPPAPPALPAREIASLELALNDAKARLDRALAAQDRFIASVSHEIKTPIAVLLAQSHTLAHEDLPSNAKAFVRSVTDEMRILGRMVESLLLLSRFRSEGVVQRQLHALNDVVMDAVSVSTPQGAAQGVSIATTLSDEEPAPVVAGEPDLLRLMLESVLRHAIRVSPRGSRVTVSVASDAESARVVVKDEGPPAPPAMAEAMFDRARNPALTGRPGRGYDTGLSIAQGIALAHEGAIEVSVPPGEGCAFVVRLPRRSAPREQDDATPALNGSQPHESRFMTPSSAS